MFTTLRPSSPRRSRPLVAGALLAIFALSPFLAGGCGEAADTEFRTVALNAIGGGVKAMLGGVVDGVVALLIPDPPTGEPSGTGEDTTGGSTESL
jgi:hypothetical protein